MFQLGYAAINSDSKQDPNVRVNQISWKQKYKNIDEDFIKTEQVSSGNRTIQKQMGVETMNMYEGQDQILVKQNLLNSNQVRVQVHEEETFNGMVWIWLFFIW